MVRGSSAPGVDQWANRVGCDRGDRLIDVLNISMSVCLVQGVVYPCVWPGEPRRAGGPACVLRRAHPALNYLQTMVKRKRHLINVLRERNFYRPILIILFVTKNLITV